MAQSRVAGHAQQVELADDIAEDDCAIAGHNLLSPKRANNQIAVFRSLLARKATFFEVLMWIGSPVAGLRPMRAARLRTCRIPSSGDFHPLALLQVLGDHANEFF
jgi:hypothetical protein